MDPLKEWADLKNSTNIDFAREYVMRPDPVSTGVLALDSGLGGGIPVSTFTAIAGEPGTGKSALACVAAYYGALNGRLVVYYSFEMPASMVVSRLLSIHTSQKRRVEQASGVPFEHMTKQVWWSSTERLVEHNAGHRITTDAEAIDYIARYSGYDNVLVAWNDFSRTIWPRISVMESMPDIAYVCSHVKRLTDSGLVILPIVDYVQLGANGDGKEYERLSLASRQLQQTCKSCRVPMIVISSMRNLGRDERKEAPTLSMLRGSGNIGYDAGTVIMLQRDRKAEESMDESRLKHETPILAHIIKNRVGPSGISIPLTFNGGKNSFE